ncbi:MAG TPA: MAE_28990/MAE_18760 family HEPN-like nuclease [Archangium sp.]|uniref:HEPN domain-containing protein n=1 Tax=Archangium sp. TaxID=1872627 RepID=UPI002E34197E|nr:MAE_28990/MAE_18760 family HEPN-like nuclease [Archangium sp.]HEX5749346.1 MAE_28990/MAE_18760 family HEPN-like nuclease [Archangium sp.]
MDELITELADLKALVASIEPVNLALAGHKDTVVQQYVSIRRRFDYAAFAVALYASFEKFVENLITAYVRLESRRVAYAALPQKLTDKHLAGTAELLWRGRLGEGRYVGMSELGVVKNLFECLSGTTPYALNEAVVIAHDANLRAGEVDAAFGAVGIEKICDRACRADAMVAWYCAAQGLDTVPQDRVKRTVLEERLKDIVERRNQVAHRGGNPVDLLGSAAMSDAVAFIESFSRSIFGLVVGRYLEAHHNASANRIELALHAGDGPFKNQTIVVVDKPAQRLFVGQPVFVVLESTGARWGRIQSLRIDDADVEEVEPSANAPKGIGVGLDFKYPKNPDVKLVALTSDDDVVWSPLNVAAAPAA